LTCPLISVRNVLLLFILIDLLPVFRPSVLGVTLSPSFGPSEGYYSQN
jgi:hypothetical protein